MNHNKPFISLTFLSQIVTKESAIIDGPNEIVASMPGRDHRTMVKYENRNESGYNQFVDAIKNVLVDIRLEGGGSSGT
jgi:hypothetical protein